jgi:hypothetical protein
MVTCSKEKDADLFDAVLGGLGQFGIITRARIPLAPAPARARWLRLLYTGAADLTADQERLIADDERRGGALAGLMDYVEGSVVTDLQQGLIGSWRSQPPPSSSSIYSATDAARIAALAEEAGGVLYFLEGAVYYGGASDTTAADVDKVINTIDVRPTAGFYVHTPVVPPKPRDLWMVDLDCRLQPLACDACMSGGAASAVVQRQHRTCMACRCRALVVHIIPKLFGHFSPLLTYTSFQFYKTKTCTHPFEESKPRDFEATVLACTTVC